MRTPPDEGKNMPIALIKHLSFPEAYLEAAKEQYHCWRDADWFIMVKAIHGESSFVKYLADGKR